MRNSTITLTDSEYELLKDKPHSELSEWVQSKLGMDIVIGYGYYGCTHIYEENGHYAVDYSTGGSCD